MLLAQCITFSLNAEISPHIITFFIRSLPADIKPITHQQIAQKIGTPGKVTKSMIKKALHTQHIYSGIYVAYAGFVSRSDMHGQVIFPRKNSTPDLRLVVVPHLQAQPIAPDKPATITGFTIPKGTAYSSYIYRRIHDPLTQEYAWQVTQDNNPDTTIVWDWLLIFAHPDNIVVTPGTFATIMGENLVLPTVYATSKLTSALNALEFLTIRQYFAPVKTKFTIIREGYQERVIA
jgi:hypothetical protein